MTSTTAIGAPGVWDAAQCARLGEINQQLIETLRHDALERPAGYAAPPLIAQLGEEWRSLDAAAERRLSTCPYLLLDAGFTQPERWQRPRQPLVLDAGAAGAFFRGQRGATLVRRALVFAWHLAACNPPMACVCLGTGSATVARIAESSLSELEALAERAPPWIAPRWEHQPRVWRQLLRAAVAADALVLRQAQLRGLQLLAARTGSSATGH